MISDGEANNIIDWGRSQGFTQQQVLSLLEARDNELKEVQAQAESDKKYEEEKAKIEAERKKAKEEEATETALEKSFTFQTGVEPEEEVAPVGILKPEVEKTAKEKNAELVNQTKAENDKRQGTDFDTWYTDVFLPQQKKTNPVFADSKGFKSTYARVKHGMNFWGGEFEEFTQWRFDKPAYKRQQEMRRSEELQRKAQGLPSDLSSYSREFWENENINIDDEYKKWQGEKNVDTPDNALETPSFEDYEAVQLPSAAGTTTTYRVKEGVEAGTDKQVISAEEYNKLKTEEEDQQIADDPSLGIYKKQQEAKGNKDFKFYEAKYKEALDNNDSETAKHYFHKIKETGKESKVIPSDNNLAGEMSKYFKLKDAELKQGTYTPEKMKKAEKLGVVSTGFLDYYSEEEAQELLRKRIQEVENEPSEHMFSQEDLEKAGIDSEDFHNFVNNSNNKNQINQNYVFDFDENGNVVQKDAPGILIAKDKDVFKANILNGYLNSKIQPLKKMEQQYKNLGIVDDVEHLNGLQLSLKDGKTELDTKIQTAKDYAADIKSGKIERTEENLDRLISMNAEVEVLTNEFNSNIVEYNDYFKDESKSKLIDGYTDLSNQYKDFQELYLKTYASNETLIKQKLEADTPTNLELYQKNPTFGRGVKAYAGLVGDVAENLGNVYTNFWTGSFAVLQNIVSNLAGANSEEKLRMMSNWTNLQDQYLEMNFIEYGSMMKENGDINSWAVPGQLARTVGDIFAMAKGGQIVRGGIRGLGRGGKYLSHQVGLNKTTLDKLFDVSRRRVLAPITTKAVNATSQFLGVTPVIFPGKLREAMSQISDDFTADDALKYAWQATTIESAIEMINPDIKLLNRWKAFSKADARKWHLWKSGANIKKVAKIFGQSLTTVPAELLEENLQEFYGGQINAMYNRLHETEFHIPTAADYKAVNTLTPMAILIAGGVRTRAFRRGDKSNMAQGALEDLPAFTKELDKQLELYESTNGKEGISKEDHKRILEEVVEYGIMKDKLGPGLINNLSPDEQYEWISLMAQKEKIEEQIKDPKVQNKEELQKDLDEANRKMKDLSKKVQMTTASQKEIDLDNEINDLENELKDTESNPQGSPESLAIIEEAKKLREQRNKVRQETPLYSFNNKAYDTEEEFLEAIDEAKRNGFFKNNKNPLIKISHRVPNGHDVKAKVYETMGEDAPDINNYSGRKLMSEQEINESEKLLNKEEYFGKTIKDLEFDLLEEQDPAKRSEIEQALEYLRIKDRGYTVDPKTGAFVMTGKDIDFSRAKKLAVERYIKAAEEVAEAAGARSIVVGNAEVEAWIASGTLDPNARGANGFFMADIEFELDEDGNRILDSKGKPKTKIVGYMWVVNKDAAIKFGQSATATHEMLHGIMWSVLNGPTRILLDKDGKQVLDPNGKPVEVNMTEEGKKLLKGFLKLLPKKYVDILNGKLDKGGYRFNEYGDDDVGIKGTEKAFEEYGEEYLNMFHEAVVVDKTIPQEENKSLFRKIIDWFNSFFKEEADNELTNIDIKTPEELMQFLKTYNAQAMKGKFDDQVKELAKRSYEQYREDKPERLMLSRTEINEDLDLKEPLDKFVKNPDGTQKYDNQEEFQLSQDWIDAWDTIENSPLLDGAIANQAMNEGLTVVPADFIKKVKKRLGEKFSAEFKPNKESGGNDSLFGWLFGITKGGRSIVQYAAGDVVGDVKEEIPTVSESEEIIEKFEAGEDAGIREFEERNILQEQLEEHRRKQEGRPKKKIVRPGEVVVLDTLGFADKVNKAIEKVVNVAQVILKDPVTGKVLTYKDIKGLVTSVKKITRTDPITGKIILDKKTKKPKLFNPTKASDVIPTGPLYGVLETIAKEIGIDPKKILANQNLNETERKAVQEWLDGKAREIKDGAIPFQHTRSGKATGIPPSLLNTYFTKGVRADMAEGFDPQGLTLWILNEMTLNQFKKPLGIENGKYDSTNTSLDPILRSMVVQVASIVANQTTRLDPIVKAKNPMDVLGLVGDGRSAIAFSNGPAKGNKAKWNNTRFLLQGFGSIDRVFKSPEARAEFWELLPAFAQQAINNNDKKSIEIALYQAYGPTVVAEKIPEITNILYSAIQEVGKKIPKRATEIIKEEALVELLLQKSQNAETTIQEFTKTPVAVALGFRTQEYVDNVIAADKRFVAERWNPKDIAGSIRYIFQMKGHSFTSPTRSQAYRGGVRQWTEEIFGIFNTGMVDAKGNPIYTSRLDNKLRFTLYASGGINTNSITYDGKPIDVDVSFSINESENALNDLKDPVLEKKREQDEREAQEFLNDYAKFYSDLFKEGVISNIELAMIQGALISHMSSVAGRAASLKYISENAYDILSKGGDLRYEHMQPRVGIVIKIFDAHLNGTGVEDVGKFFENYNIAIIPTTMDDVIKEAGLESSLFKGQTMDMPAWIRYFNELTRVKSKGRLVGLLDVKNNNKLLTISEAYKMAEEILLNDLDNKNNFTRAVMLSRSTQPSKGITILDFDDTLATTKSLVRFTAPDGTTGALNAEEYASQYQDLLEKGYTFDFTEFDKVIKAKLAPLFNKALKLQKKFGPESMFILTARPQAAQQAIFDFLKANGLNISIENISTLGNSTSDAKALWVLEKVAEGYNDFYFADDALQNVQAVKNMLGQFDVKSKVQQAKIQFSKGASLEFNEMLERTKGLPADYKISRAKAKQRGKKKGRFTIWIPPSAEDFAGLMMMFQGKGKQGMEDAAWIKKHLLDPFARADRDLNSARQRTANEFKALRKRFPKVAKKLRKIIPTGDYTYGDAMRVYLWDKAGMEIPGLSNTDKQNMLDLVNGDPDLQAFAEVLGEISRKEEGYVAPDEYWMTKDIVADLTEDGVIGDGRKEHFAEWQEKVDTIFSEENLNKIEFIYGSKFREALEDMLYRMKNGSNRPAGQNRIVNQFLNWLNGGISVVMNWNSRSAVLQTLSTVNFINWGDNNILAAAKAFANQKQFWKDFTFIFNSDMLRQRRAGLKTTIESNELMSEVEGAVNPARAAIRYLLRIGFTPTKIADSFAIAMGGSTFYRNRINTYLKQGMTQAEAESQAWLDFQELAEETQQSSRPDRISMQQASVLGRLILAFQNTPMQYMRLSKKEILDIVNGRYEGITGPNSLASKAGKIAYYTAIQNLIFYSMQTALFAMMFGGDDDEEFFKEKKQRVADNMADGILRGLGVHGAVISTIKNIILKRAAGDRDSILVEALKVSPPLSIKARQLLSADRTLRWNKDIIKEMETFDIDNPMWNAIFNVVEFSTNLPLSRMESKYKNVRESLNKQHETWQRIAFLLGWAPWNFNIKNKQIEEVKEEVKIQKTYERKKKQKIKKAEKQAEEQAKIDKQIKKEKELQDKGILVDPKCSYVSTKGSRCKNSVTNAGDACTIHEEVPQRVDGKNTQCKKVKKDGKKCKMQTSNKSGYCYYHD